jgi:hypothetical protein
MFVFTCLIHNILGACNFRSLVWRKVSGDSELSTRGRLQVVGTSSGCSSILRSWGSDHADDEWQ